MKIYNGYLLKLFNKRHLIGIDEQKFENSLTLFVEHTSCCIIITQFTCEISQRQTFRLTAQRIIPSGNRSRSILIEF